MKKRVLQIADELLAGRHVPSATYRLQFGPDFTFHDAANLVPYLHDLGITDCYASPILKARAGSVHGYDICDHSLLNPELGGEEGFCELARELRSKKMGLIFDTVPNHMGLDESNLWWMDVLENGPSSVYASFFDIDWHPAKPELENKVLLPLLEDLYGKVLESGKLRLWFEEGSFFIRYYNHRLPVAPRTYSRILNYTLSLLCRYLPEGNEHLQEFQSILTALNYLPPRTETDPAKVDERFREKEIVKRRLASLYRLCPEVTEAIEESVTYFNGVPGDPHSYDALADLIEAQAYRAAFWRVAADEINYRRFFDINDLAAIRVERPETFRATHQVVFRLLREGTVTGLRIDHPDGLWNPTGYFEDLQYAYLLEQVRARLGSAENSPEVEEALSGWFASARPGGRPGPLRPLWVVAEKILCDVELLPEDWAVDGTTGYDFLNLVNGLFVDRSHEKLFDRIYSRFTGTRTDFGDLVNSTKKTIMLVSLASEIELLSLYLDRLSEKNRLYRDFTHNTLTFAIREVIAALPVYRTYIQDGRPTEMDRRNIESAVSEARRRNPRTAKAVFDFVRDVLLLRNIQDFRAEDRPGLTDFVMKFQQLTGPVTAKGVEDTAFYIYNRLVSLNEVGGQPDRFGRSLADFHKENSERGRNFPCSMLATSTHDCKRAEDVRARINILSEMPGEWQPNLSRWARMNARRKTMVQGMPAPDRNEEYLLYQTLIGCWPEGGVGEDATGAESSGFRERIAAFMLKAIREAKVHSSWINPNQEYEAAARSFVMAILDNQAPNRFLDDFQSFGRRVAFFGQFNSLSQVVLKLSSPGVPDVYRGTELWDLSLVDPDNRRPVDWRRREAMLKQLREAMATARAKDGHLLDFASGLLSNSRDGRIKLYCMHRALQLRHEHRELFLRGAYLPLRAEGEKREHVCAFLREREGAHLITVVPCLVFGLTGGAEVPPVGESVWGETVLPVPREHAGAEFVNAFTGALVPWLEHAGSPALQMRSVLGHFPVALLEAKHP